MASAKKVRWIIIGIILGIALILVLPFVALNSLSDKVYSRQELMENYVAKAKEIHAVKSYIDSITTPGISVEIEFKNDKTIAIFHINNNGAYERNWDLELDSKKTDSLLSKLHWTRENLLTIKQKLDKAGCISVNSAAPCTIGWKRSGYGKYSYDIFSHPIADSLKKEYNDGCKYLLYNDSVALEYGGGVIGPQCFP